MANGHGRFYAGQSPIRGRIQKVGSDAVDPIDAMTERLMLIVDGMDAMTLKEDVDVLQSLRSEEHTSELQSLMRISYAVFCLKKKRAWQSAYYCEYTDYTYCAQRYSVHYDNTSLCFYH